MGFIVNIILSALALFNSLFLISFLAFSLFGVEAWIDWPSAGIFFAYSTVFLIPNTLEIMSKEYRTGNNIKHSLNNLLLGCFNLLILMFLHWILSSDTNLVAGAWCLTLYIGVSFKLKLSPPLKK